QRNACLNGINRITERANRLGLLNENEKQQQQQQPLTEIDEINNYINTNTNGEIKYLIMTATKSSVNEFLLHQPMSIDGVKSILVECCKRYTSTDLTMLFA